jgi:hypothetical protein
MAWHVPQASVAVADHDAGPWQEFEQLRLVAFQPMLEVRSVVPLLCVALFTVVEL